MEAKFIIDFLLAKKIPFWYDSEEIMVDGDVSVKSHLKELIERGATLVDGKLKFILIPNEKTEEGIRDLIKKYNADSDYPIVAKIDELIQKAKEEGYIFIHHIENHLKEGENVVCKICGKTADEIISEELGEED